MILIEKIAKHKLEIAVFLSILLLLEILYKLHQYKTTHPQESVKSSLSNSNQKVEEEKIQKNFSVTLVSSPTPSISIKPKITEWQTYTSRYGYTIKYPKDWEIKYSDWQENGIYYGLQPDDEAIRFSRHVP